MNVRSLLRNLNETLVVMDGFDIVGISESWLHESISSSHIGFEGYKLYRQDRGQHNPNKKRGGGLVIYVKNDISAYSNLVLPYCKVSSHLEQLWLEICKPNYRRQFVGVIYRPPSDTVKDFIAELEYSLEMIDMSCSSYEITLIGDFNINYKKTNSPEFKAIKELERKFHLKQYIKNPTRVTNTVKSTIDLIFSNMSMVSESGVLNDMIADHFPIYIVKKKDRNDKGFTYSFGRSYKNYNKDIFQELIRSNMSWRSFWIKTNSPDELWDIMLTIITEAADTICPIKRIKICNNVPGWISKEVIEAISSKKARMTIFKRTGQECDWVLYKDHKRYVRNMLVQARRTVILASLEDNRQNPKRFWRILNTDLGLSDKKPKSCQGFARIKNDSGKILDGVDACSYMSNYYAQNGVRLASKFKDSVQTTDSVIPSIESVFLFSFISLDVVGRLVKNIEVSKSSGITHLSSMLLKDAFTTLIPELTHLFNESISTGIFPATWRVGTITPILKEGDPLEPGNWRPITLLPLPSKLLEKAIHFQVNSFLMNNNILDNRQHGFRAMFSTSTAIFQLVKELFNKYDEGKCTSCIFVDYRKAFETLDHNILCQKLLRYNFSPRVVNWFRSYLTGRKHVVCTNNFTSELSEISYGVPQGCTLGPLLFIIYVNDLLGSLVATPDANVIMYADDTVLYANHIDPKSCVKNCQQLLDRLYIWCQYNKLTINISKTKHMFVARKKDQRNQVKGEQVSINNTNLNNVDSYTYLGVDIDYSLSFDTMVDNMYKKANRKLYTLKLIRPYITNSIACLIYKT